MNALQSIGALKQRITALARDIGLSPKELERLCLSHGLDALETTGIRVRAAEQNRRHDVCSIALPLSLELVFATHKRASAEGASIEEVVVSALARYVSHIELSSDDFRAIAEEAGRNEKTLPVMMPRNAVLMIREVCEAAEVSTDDMLSWPVEEMAESSVSDQGKQGMTGVIDMITSSRLLTDEGAGMARMQAVLERWEADPKTIVRRKEAVL
jgi:hypothetical protein